MKATRTFGYACGCAVIMMSHHALAAETIVVTSPHAGTELVLGEDAFATWENAPSGGQVRADLYRNGVLVDEFHQWTANDGNLGRCCIPSAWGTGGGFQLLLMHSNEVDFGWSDSFSIVGEMETITISHPDSMTYEVHGHDVAIDWSGAPGGGQVAIDLYLGDMEIGPYHADTDNDGHATRCCIPSDWGIGFGYRLKMTHLQSGEIGWSDPFTIMCNRSDVDLSGSVGFSDLVQMLSKWGPVDCGVIEDIDGDCAVTFDDVVVVLSNWGPCSN